MIPVPEVGQTYTAKHGLITVLSVTTIEAPPPQNFDLAIKFKYISGTTGHCFVAGWKRMFLE